jgi:hypothetical protein
VTPLGRLRCGDILRRYRVNGAPKGHRKTDKARKRREAAANRRAMAPTRQDRKRERQAHRERRRRIAAGLPLFTADELDNC